MKVPRYTCLRCNHEWYPRPKRDGTISKARECPNCHSAYWDRPRKEQS